MRQRPNLRRSYRIELAEELTGKAWPTIKKLMARKGITLAEAIKRYIIKQFRDK